MKFGKRLKHQVQETLPGWHDKFLSYKDLKKLVKLISSATPLANGSLECEGDFVSLLNDELEKFNAFFMEQEEDFIIRHKEIQQRIQMVIEIWGPNGSQPSEANYNNQMAMIRKDIVNFHGEMVLLLNYSNINYTGLAKILKKYDKRTGGLLRLAFIQKVLQQPFYTTDLISKLVRECESIIDIVLFPVSAAAATERENENVDVERERERERERAVVVAAAAAAAGELGILRNTVAALVTMREMRRGSSTYSHFSLPPLSFPDSHDDDQLLHSLQLTNSLIPIL